MQKIASESMIPTYRSGTEPLQKANVAGGHYAKQTQQQQQQSGQQQNNGSFSAKGDNKNAVNNEFKQNQCNSPVKRRSISQSDVRNIQSYSSDFRSQLTHPHLLFRASFVYFCVLWILF